MENCSVDQEGAPSKSLTTAQDSSELSSLQGKKQPCDKDTMKNRTSFITLVCVLVAVAGLLKVSGCDHYRITPTTNHRKLRQVLSPYNNTQQTQRRQKEYDRRLSLLQRDYVDCSKYEFTQSISEVLRINYVVKLDENDPSKGTFSAELVLLDEAWLGFGHSENGAMMNSMAVLGLPDAKPPFQVQKYRLGTYQTTDLEGIPQALPAVQQTLMNASLTQADGVTRMRFTKLLVEPNEQTIEPNWQNIFLFAHGTSNTLGYHEARGVLALDLRPCVPSVPENERPELSNQLQDPEVEDRQESASNYSVISIGNGFGVGDDGFGEAGGEGIGSNDTVSAAGLPYTVKRPIVMDENDDVAFAQGFTDDVTATTMGTSNSEEENTSSNTKSEIIWILHGFCAMLSCCILLPVVIASTILPGCFGGKTKPDNISGNRLFRWNNILLLVAIIATFTTALIGSAMKTQSQKASSISKYSKSSSYHAPAGLGLSIVFVFFALAGALRSFLKLTPAGLEERDGLPRNANESGPSDFNSEDVKSVDRALASLTRIFDNSHRLVGIILAFVSCWQCQSGLDIFAAQYENSWFTAAVFWGISAPVFAVVATLCLLQMVRYCHGEWKYALQSSLSSESNTDNCDTRWLAGLFRSVIDWRNGVTRQRTGDGIETILGIRR